MDLAVDLAKDLEDLAMTIKAPTFHKPLLGALLLGVSLSYAHWTMAEEISTGPQLNRFEQGYQNHLTQVEQRLQQMKQKLGIHSSQESEWQRYRQEVMANIEQRHQQLLNAYQRPADSAPQHFAHIVQLRQDQLMTLRKEANAFNRLYEKLSPDQQQQADQYFAKGKQHLLDLPNHP